MKTFKTQTFVASLFILMAAGIAMASRSTTNLDTKNEPEPKSEIVLVDKAADCAIMTNYERFYDNPILTHSPTLHA